MYKFLGILWLAALPFVAVGQSSGEWKEFVSKTSGFAVQFPGMPQEYQHSVKTATGTIYVVITNLEWKKGAVNFVVASSDLTESAIQGETEARRLDNARDGAVTSVKGKLKSEKQIKLDGNPGRELIIQGDGTTMVRARLYFVKNRLYQVMVVGSKELVDSKDTAKFLESFKLVK